MEYRKNDGKKFDLSDLPPVKLINAIKEVTAARVKSASFATETPCAIQAEGEIYDGMKLEAHIVEGGLKFYLPARED